MNIENESSLLNEIIKIMPKNSPFTSSKSNSLSNKSNDNSNNLLVNYTTAKQKKNQDKSRNKNYTLFLSSLSSTKNVFDLKSKYQNQDNKLLTIKKKNLFNNNNTNNKNINLKKLINNVNIQGRNKPQPLRGDILPFLSQSPTSKSIFTPPNNSPIQIKKDIEDFPSSIKKLKFSPFKLSNEKNNLNNSYIRFHGDKYKKLKLKSFDNSKFINQSINNSNIDNISEININFLSRTKDENNSFLSPNNNSINNNSQIEFNDKGSKIKYVNIKKLLNNSSLLLNANNHNLKDGLNQNPQIVNISIGNISINENNNNYNINNQNNQKINDKNNEKNMVRPKSCSSIRSMKSMKSIKHINVKDLMNERRLQKISNNELESYNIKQKILGSFNEYKENENKEKIQNINKEKNENNENKENNEVKENSESENKESEHEHEHIITFENMQIENNEIKDVEKPPKNNTILATLSKKLQIKNSDVNIIINNIRKKMSYDSKENSKENENNTALLQNFENKNDNHGVHILKSKTHKIKHILNMNFKDSYFYHESKANISNIYSTYVYEQTSTNNESEKFLKNLKSKINNIYLSKIKDELISSKISLISFSKKKPSRKLSRKKSFMRKNSLRDPTHNNIISFNNEALNNYLKQNDFNSFFNDNFELYKLTNIRKNCGTNRTIAKYLNHNHEFDEIDLKRALKKTNKKSITYNPTELQNLRLGLKKYKTIQGIDKSLNNGYFKLRKSEVFKYDRNIYSNFTDASIMFIHNLILRTEIYTSKIQNFFDEDKIKNKNLQAIKHIDPSNLLSKKIRYSLCKINSLTQIQPDGSQIRRRGGVINFTPIKFDVIPIKKSMSKKITDQKLSVLGQKSFFVNAEKKKVDENKNELPVIFDVNDIEADGKKGQYLLNNYKTIEDLYWGLCFLLLEKDFDLFILKLEELKSVIDINYQLFDGNTFLIISTQQGNSKVVKFLCQKKCDINIQNILGNTALHYAIGNLFFDIVDILINFGAREDILNQKGLSPWDCIENKLE